MSSQTLIDCSFILIQLFHTKQQETNKAPLNTTTNEWTSAALQLHTNEAWERRKRELFPGWMWETEARPSAV